MKKYLIATNGYTYTIEAVQMTVSDNGNYICFYDDATLIGITPITSTVIPYI